MIGSSCCNWVNLFVRSGLLLGYYTHRYLVRGHLEKMFHFLQLPFFTNQDIWMKTRPLFPRVLLLLFI